MTSPLDSINEPGDLSGLTAGGMERLAEQIRELIVQVVSRNRGHLASNLGTVELTLALHRCFDFSRDRLVWDCGHQAYTHKIITGRREEFHTLRQAGGISGFADQRESDYDPFTFGHTSTSISAALGLTCADELTGADRRVVAVIGDGAIAAGMAFEALNHAGEMNRDLLVVLNDNKMSISRSVGAFERYLSKVRSSAPYTGLKQELHELLEGVPLVGRRFDEVLARVRGGLQSALTPGGLFAELGFHYYGPADGHDIEELIATFNSVKRIAGPVLVHVLTEKGHGFRPAQEDPTRFHSSRRFELDNGTLANVEESAGTSYSAAFGRALCELAEADERIVALTAAMPDGTGLGEFAERFPHRFYNVGICEQHGVGLAGGLAAGGLRPVFAVYSTFLQRAYDQLSHDIALQGQHAVFCIDRAGLVGSDGPTHHGLHDIAYCRGMGGFAVMAPRNGAELRRMLRMAVELDRPAAVRYPRENVPEGEFPGEGPPFELGEAELLKEGEKAAIIAYGALVERALEAARLVAEEDGLEVTVVNARFAAPLDIDAIGAVVRDCPAVLLAEDHSTVGGFGSAVLEGLADRGIPAAHVRRAGVPPEPVDHAPRERQLAQLELDGPGLAGRLRRLLDSI
jgi:1-deoxy-D-xylulose-5-phosphate synthase